MNSTAISLIETGFLGGLVVLLGVVIWQLASANALARRTHELLEKQQKGLDVFTKRLDEVVLRPILAPARPAAAPSQDTTERMTIMGYRKPSFTPDQPKTAKPPNPDEAGSRKVKRW